jgi:prophage antirepressor-like protein
MNELQVFSNPTFGKIRTILKDGDWWFVAKDLCEALGYTWSGSRIAHVPDKWKGMTSVVTPGGKQDVTVLSQNGVNFFLLRSDKPAALPLQEWIAGEVLPSIQKTGAYLTDTAIGQLINDPKSFIKLLTAYAEERDKSKALEADNAVMKPKAEYFDALVDTNLLTGFRDTAKELYVGQKELIDWLLRHKFIFRTRENLLRPYMQHTPELFQVKERLDRQSGHSHPQTMITPRGRETFRLLLEQEQRTQ